MAIKPETRIAQRIMIWLKTNYDFYGYHVHGSLMQRKGEPDLDGSVCINQQWVHLKLEVKTETGQPSEIQLERLREYHKRGYLTGIVTSIEDVQVLIYAWQDYKEDIARGSLHNFIYYAHKYGLKDRWEIWKQ